MLTVEDAVGDQSTRVVGLARRAARDRLAVATVERVAVKRNDGSARALAADVEGSTAWTHAETSSP